MSIKILRGFAIVSGTRGEISLLVVCCCCVMRIFVATTWGCVKWRAQSPSDRTFGFPEEDSNLGHLQNLRVMRRLLLLFVLSDGFTWSTKSIGWGWRCDSSLHARLVDNDDDDDKRNRWWKNFFHWLLASAIFTLKTFLLNFNIPWDSLAVVVVICLWLSDIRYHTSHVRSFFFFLFTSEWLTHNHLFMCQFFSLLNTEIG